MSNVPAHRLPALLLCVVCMLLASLALAEGSRSQCDQALVDSIPLRPSGAPGGSDFVRSVRGMSEAEREGAVRVELLRGNLPLFLRKLVPIPITPGPGTRESQIAVCVLPEYLAIGSDEDHVLVPMSLATALMIASHFGFVLPTPKIVDAVHHHAAQLSPQPMPPGPAMRSTDYLWRHHRLVAEQRQLLGVRSGTLVAGHKKDLVVTEIMWIKPDRVAIYGWHRRDGRPIQPLSTVHGVAYSDYSHGVRLVSAIAYVNGRPRSIYELMRDAVLGHALVEAGPRARLGELVEALVARSRSTNTLAY